MAGQSQLVCELCGIHVNHEQALRAHLIGRRHRMALDRAEVADRSVYVRGFPPEQVQEGDLRKLFQQFGTIRSIAFDVHKKLFAILEFSDVPSALRVLHLPPASLELYGKRLVVRPREAKPLQRRGRPVSEGRSPPSDGGGQQLMEMEGGAAGSTLHHIGGVLLPQETAVALLQARSIGEQMEVLSSGCRLPEATLEAHLSLCHELQSLFRRSFPHCMLVPFGSPVSGHAMVTSDCDLCLLTHPSEDDMRYLSPENYFSAKLWAIWQRVSSVPSTDSSMGATPRPTTSFSRKNPHCPPEYDLALAIVRSAPHCFKVHQIAFARVPIVSFSYQPTGIHCDISINNRLGPYNTRLMRAYYEFDGGVAVLVPIVRLWMRASDIPRAQLNSYAILLMLVYALQHTFPPVLPSLQALGPWPRNMQWFASQGFAAAAAPAPPTVAGWRCGFTDPNTLMPSSNTVSPAELLLHFFQFYSEQFIFSRHVVAIHHTPGSSLTIQQAIDRSAQERAPTSVPGKSMWFKVGPLCIQDPFDLSHNVAKSFSHGSMAHLRKQFTIARDTLRKQLHLEAAGDVSQTGASLLAVLDPNQRDLDPNQRDQGTAALPGVGLSGQAAAVSSERLTRLLHFTPARIVSLLQRVDSLQLLGRSLQELDLSNLAIVRKLAAIVLKVLVLILKQEVNIDCTPVHRNKSSGSAGSLLDTCHVAVTQQTHESVTLDPTPQLPEHTPPPSGGAQAPPTAMECDTVDCEGLSSEAVRKRQYVVACAEAENPKRARLQSEPQTPVLALLLSEAEGAAEAYCCTAYSTTWLHRRQARRQPLRHPGAPSAEAAVLPVPTEEPVLEFLLATDENLAAAVDPSSSPPLSTLFTVELQATQSLYSKEFAQFFAFFKKVVLYGIRSIPTK